MTMRLIPGGKKKMCMLSNLAGKTVNDLLEDANVKKSEIPRNLDKLLKGLKIAAMPMDFSQLERILEDDVKKWGNILGAVAINKKNEIGIYYRAGSSLDRINFTVAHELAHCCLHQKQLEKGHILMRYDGYFKDDDEYIANVFAGELLMPEECIRKEFEQEPRPRIFDLASKYKVSINVMRARLEYLEMFEKPQYI